MKKYRTVLLNQAWLLGMAAVVLAVMFGLFYCRDKVFEGFARGLKLCGGVLIPSLFPFMFLANFIALSPLSSLLAKIVSPITQILFGFGGRAGVSIVLSFVSGYPVAARLGQQLYEEGELSYNEARRFIAFGVNPGPAFCVSAVGAVLLGSAKAGALILCSVLLSSAAVGIITKPRKNIKPQMPARNEPKSSAAAFCLSAEISAKSVGMICAYTLLFSALSQLIKTLLFAQCWAKYIMPLLEITSGLAALGRCPLPVFAAFISFGSLSVLLQVISFAPSLNLKLGELLLGRLGCAALSAIFCGALLSVFPVQLPDLSVMAYSARLERDDIMASVCLVATVFVFLGYVGQLFFEKIQKI